MKRKQKLTLGAWAQKQFEKPPTTHTLRRWARDLKIFPFPQKVGREYLVDPDARYVDHNKPRNYGT